MSEPMIFVGREDERETIHQLIAEREKAVICVKGRSKMGKTHLALKLLEELNEKPNTFCGFYRAEAAIEDPTYPFLYVLSQILQAYDKEELSEKVKETIGRAFATAARQRAGELVGAVAQDAMGSLIKQLTKHLDLTKTTETMGNIIADASKSWTSSAELSTMLAENKPAVVTGFLQLCRNLADSIAPEDRFVFLFDQVEHTSDIFWELILALARNLPERFYIVFTLNEEHEGGVEFWKKHGAELSSYGTQEIGLEGFSLEELRDLIDKHNKPPKDHGTLEVARRTTGGRPYLLDSWVRSDDYDDNVAPKDEERFKEYHRQRLLACPEEGRRVAKALALLPNALPGGLKDYRICFGKESIEEVEEFFDNLLQHGIFRRLPLKIWFIHEEMQDFIREDMDPAVQEELAKSLIDGLQRLDPELLERPSPYSLYAASLFTYTNDYENSYKLNLFWGKFFYPVGELLYAWGFYQEALRAAEALGDRTKHGAVLNEMGIICAIWGQYKNSIRYHKRALDNFLAEGDREGEAAALNNLAGAYSDLGELGRALEYYNLSLSICREEGNRSGEASTLNNIGLVYNELGQHMKALEYLHNARDINQDKESHFEATVLNNIGMTYPPLGEFRDAIDCFLQTLNLCKKKGYKRPWVVALYNLGSVYDSQGERQGALELYEKALPICREIGDRKSEANVLNNMGAVCDDLGFKERAVEHYEQALIISREIGDRNGEAVTLSNLGTFYYNHNEDDKALSNLKVALSVHQEIGNKAGEALVLNNIAFIYERRGMLAEAVALMEQVVEIGEEINRPDLEKDRAALEEFRQRLSEQQ